MPRTEWTGETGYSAAIEAMTGGEVTEDMLLGPWPRWESAKRHAPAPATTQEAA